MKLPLDKIIDKIVALGVPGLVLVVVIATSGYAGAAAITAALAMLGGPLGMIGGFATLGLLVLISKALTEYGLETIAKKVTKGLRNKGMSVKDIKDKISSYPISKGLKHKLFDLLAKHS